MQTILQKAFHPLMRDILLVIERVAARVKKGGHHIPSDVVARRYQRGIKNFF